jgi:hypothetical protein
MAYTGKRFIRQANNPTVYLREGNQIRPIASPEEFQMLAGTNDIAGNTDIVDNLDQFNKPVGSYQGLTDAEKANYLTQAQNQYAGTRKQFADLINGKLSSTDLAYEDAKTRLNRGAEDAITGAAQDLSSRGFLRSGEQIDRTVRAKEDAATNIGRADIQRQIDRANLLLQQTNFESDLNKQAIGDANTAIGNETTNRQNAYNNAVQASEAEKTRLAQTWDTAAALQASREDRAFKKQQLQMELAKLRASSGSGGLDMTSLLTAIKGMTPQQKAAFGFTDITPEDLTAFGADTAWQQQNNSKSFGDLFNGKVNLTPYGPQTPKSIKDARTAAQKQADMVAALKKSKNLLGGK